jgi:hypothetical protein
MDNLDSFASDSAGTAPAGHRRDARQQQPGEQIFRWVYVHNPFYLISAALVFWGLRSSFDARAGAIQTVALMLGLTGYTLLLAVTTWLVLRLGRVWEDGRSQLLLIVLMFLAISVSLDDALATNPRVGEVCFLGGLLFAVATSEALLRGLGIRLGLLFRLPYYLILALFFLYPVLVERVPVDPFSAEYPWLLFAFSPVAGLCFLTLLPAIRRGPDYVRDNGTPWSWPWYPWVVFGLLGLGVCQRGLYLCVSMHQAGGFATIFAPYFLVPFVLVAGILLLEIGLVSRASGVLRVALAVPPVALLLASTERVGGDVALGFLADFTQRLGGSPFYLTLLAAIGFYVWAMLRRVRPASELLIVAVALLAVIGPKTSGPSALAGTWTVPLLLAGGLQLALGLSRRSSVHCLAAAGWWLAALSIELRGTAFLAYGGILPAHLLLAAVLLLGATFRDGFARFLQSLGAALLVLAAVAAPLAGPRLLPESPGVLVTLYPLAAALVALAYGHLLRRWLYHLAALGSVTVSLIAGGWHAYLFLRPRMVGLDYVLGGLASLMVAGLISSLKAGLPQRWAARWKGRSAADSFEEGVKE